MSFNSILKPIQRYVLPIVIIGFIAIPVMGQTSSTSNVLIVGGGSAHDFDRWFNLEDSKIIAETGAFVRYTDQPENVGPLLPQLDILYLSNNQPLPNTKEFRNSMFNFVESGNGLLLVHAPTWYNWSDWPEYNRELVGGGTRSHEEYGEFEVEVVATDHPIMKSVPSSFSIVDELYHFQPDDSAKEINVLAKGIVPGNGEEYPIAWTLKHGDGRIVAITLGHDAKAHYHYAYRTILKNSIEWLNANN
ncbi:ThuA domain-containing protein [Aliifodinibius sp. S!AR15-10]|uniref:ThuA domain-containing protein n=1 Tax=Aliifodinibius sp. S!AR15-10 TaxID=2950437 RepID=UPI00285DD7DC|nr:ThuA domain-containing protein [Aliifodinibius sp. S!AR15-10]MDR8390192.1 ThuA domain-containing protein [Aliifodinibius sp. S!AR15-10]